MPRCSTVLGRWEIKTRPHLSPAPVRAGLTSHSGNRLSRPGSHISASCRTWLYENVDWLMRPALETIVDRRILVSVQRTGKLTLELRVWGNRVPGEQLGA